MATWQHLRSSTANKRPTTSLADGRIAINTNTASPGLFFKDSAGTGIVKVGPVHVGTTAPNSVPASGGSTGNYLGEQWLDTSVSPAQMKVWNGSTWVGVVADELPVSKLQDGAARQLIQTDAAGTGVEWTSNVDVPGTLDVTSTATFDSIAQYPLGSAGAPTITFTGDNNTGIYSPGADQVAISTGGSGRLFVDASGNVGVGAANPRTKADISGNLYLAGGNQIQITNSAGSTGLQFIGSDSAESYIGTMGTHALVFRTGSTERLRITSAGLVGVGTSTPRGLASISNNTSGAGVVDSSVHIGNSAADFYGFRITNSSDPLATYGGLLKFQRGTGSAWSDALIISNTGSVAVGNSSPQVAFHVGPGTSSMTVPDGAGASFSPQIFNNQTSGVAGLGVGVSDGTNNRRAALFVDQTNSIWGLSSNYSSVDPSFVIRSGGSERLRITSAGLVGVGASAPATLLEVRSATTNAARLRVTGTGTTAGNFRGFEFSNGSIFKGGLLQDESTDLISIFTPIGGQSINITSAGSLGVGTTSPSFVSGYTGLQVDGGSNGPVVKLTNSTTGSTSTDGFDLILQQGGSEAYVWQRESAPLIFGTAATERLRIDSSGRVGIGSSSPSATLHVASSGNPEVLIGGAQTPILSFVGGTSSEPVIGYGVGSLRIGTVTGAGAAGFVERVRVDTQGRVGIGTTSPATPLHVNSGAISTGARLESSSTGAYLNFANSSGNSVYIGASTSAFYVETGGSERARIDSSGRLLVGTSTAFTNIYHASTVGIQAPLQVRTAANDYSTGATYLNYSASGFSPVVTLGLSKNNTAGSNTVVANNDELGYLQFVGNDGTNFRTAAWIAAQVDGTPGSADMPGRLVFSTTADGASSPTERMRISQSGLVSIPGVYSFTTAAAANVYVESAGQLSRATSSSKYKINVETIEDVYADALLSCRPVWYRSTCANDNPDWGWWGFIAEEVAAIDPRLVHWKRSEVTYDKNGSAVSTPCNPEPEGVMYDRFVPHLLNLIKRQQQAIETLEAKVAALESA